MARYILSDPGAQLKGSIGGATFQRSGKVLAIRKHNVPIQKRSARQSQRKNFFDCQQKRWKNLTPTEKASFAAETGNFTRVDSFGNVYEVSPLNLQTSSNLNLVASGLPVIDTMQSPVAFPVHTIFAIEIDTAGQGVSFDLNPSNIEPDFDLQIFSTQTLSAGTEQPPISTFKFITTIPAGGTTLQSFWPEYLAAWGDPTNKVGSIIWARFLFVSHINGQSGGELIGSGPVT